MELFLVYLHFSHIPKPNFLSCSWSFIHLYVVADTLQVPGGDEFELWVLQVIQTGLVEANMDQIQRVVVIRRCTNPVLGSAQRKVRVTFFSRDNSYRSNPRDNSSSTVVLLFYSAVLVLFPTVGVCC